MADDTMTPSQTEASPSWARSRDGRLKKANKPLVKRIAEDIKAGHREAVLATIEGWEPVDVVQLLLHLPLKRARELYEWLSLEPAKNVLAEMDSGLAGLLMEEVAINRLRELVDTLDADRAAELLASLPQATIGEVLPRLARETEISKRLAATDETARAVMSAEFIAAGADWTVARVIEHIREVARDIDELDKIYVLDAERRVLGTLRASDLVLNRRDAVVGTIMTTAVISVPEGLDQEDVAKVVMDHDLLAVPVIDAKGRMIGQVTQDDVHDIIREELEEDLKLMGGVTKDARADQSIPRMVRQRIPWLLAGLIGSSIAAIVVGSFEDELAEAVILASFIPIVMSTAGNAGIQASTVTVQALAAGQLWIGDLSWRLGKELLSGLFNGLIVSVLIGSLVIILSFFVPIDMPLRLALTAGAALTTVVIIAATWGSTVPLILDHFKVDPAVATGVFITTSNDVLGVLIFFVMATLIYLS